VEMRSLGRRLGELASQARYARDLPRLELTEALIETTAVQLGIYTVLYETINNEKAPLGSTYD